MPSVWPQAAAADGREAVLVGLVRLLRESDALPEDVPDTTLANAASAASLMATTFANAESMEISRAKLTVEETLLNDFRKHIFQNMTAM